jgi:hypothetical protein
MIDINIKLHFTSFSSSLVIIIKLKAESHGHHVVISHSTARLVWINISYFSKINFFTKYEDS